MNSDLLAEDLPLTRTQDVPVVARCRLLMVGALPPPQIGPTLANLRLSRSSAIRSQFDVEFLDISDRRAAANMGRLDCGNVLLGLQHSIQFACRLWRFRPDVVYLGISQGTWGWLRDLCFIAPAILTSRGVVLHLRGSEFRAFYDTMPVVLRSVTRWALRRTRRVIVLGERLRSVFDGLVDESRIRVIPNGIAVHEFESVKLPPRPRQQRVLFLSSLRERKGIHLVLEAFGQVVSRFPNSELTVAGVWRSEADRSRAEAIVERLGIGGHCRFVGEVAGTEKIRLLKEHDVFVFPPIQPEGLPWVILEAMSAGLPVVTTDQGAICEVVEHGHTGLIVFPAVGAVAEAICSLLAAPETATEMGALGRRRAEQRFSEETYSVAIASILHEATTEGT